MSAKSSHPVRNLLTADAEKEKKRKDKTVRG